MQPLHVCYIVKRFPRLSQTFVLNEVRELQRQGAQVSVITLRDGDAALAGQAAGIAIAALAQITSGLAAGDADGQVERLAELLQQHGVTHIHAHFATQAASMAQRLSERTGVPFSFTAHAHDIFHESVDVQQLAERMAAARMTITVSEYNRRYLRGVLEQAGMRGQIVRLYNGVDLRTIKPIAHEGEPDLVVAIGRLTAKKGFADLIEACRLLHVSGRSVRCLIVGEGEERAALELQIAAAGLEQHVTLCGAKPHGEAIQILARAAIFALPCVVGADGDRDGLPTVLLEALALGVPAISTPVTGIPELIAHEVSGLLVPERSPLALAEAIDRLRRDRALREHVRLRGMERVRADFDLARNVRALRRRFAERAA